MSVKFSKIRMMLSKVMVKLKFNYLLKHDLLIYDNSFFFSFDMSNIMWLALYI